jgi:DNA-binding Xre family transcriptional regulator
MQNIIFIEGDCMSISYKKLQNILDENDIQKKVLKLEAGISSDVISKIERNEYMNMRSLEKIAKYLSKILKRKITFDDLIDIL